MPSLQPSFPFRYIWLQTFTDILKIPSWNFGVCSLKNCTWLFEHNSTLQSCSEVNLGIVSLNLRLVVEHCILAWFVAHHCRLDLLGGKDISQTDPPLEMLRSTCHCLGPRVCHPCSFAEVWLVPLWRGLFFLGNFAENIAKYKENMS